MEIIVSFLPLISLLIPLGILIFTIYAVITFLNLTKQNNEYLKEIRDELKKGKSEH